jgi:hypothetical protein
MSLPLLQASVTPLLLYHIHICVTSVLCYTGHVLPGKQGMHVHWDYSKKSASYYMRTFKKYRCTYYSTYMLKIPCCGCEKTYLS